MTDAYDDGYAGGRAWLAEVGKEADVTDPDVEAVHAALVAGRELINSDSWTDGFTDALLGTNREWEAASDRDTAWDDALVTELEDERPAPDQAEHLPAGASARALREAADAWDGDPDVAEWLRRRADEAERGGA